MSNPSYPGPLPPPPDPVPDSTKTRCFEVQHHLIAALAANCEECCKYMPKQAVGDIDFQSILDQIRNSPYGPFIRDLLVRLVNDLLSRPV